VDSQAYKFSLMLMKKTEELVRGSRKGAAVDTGSWCGNRFLMKFVQTKVEKK